MKKLTTIIIFTIVFTSLSISQIVDNVEVEQAGDLIKIRYNILNSTVYQIFKVTIYCSINGGLKSELISISGDCGENVPGGKPKYLVLWDVLKDVEEVRSADFTVRAELVKDGTPVPKSKKIYIIPNLGGTDAWYYGLRLAYMDNWGISALFVTGKKDGGPFDPDMNLFHTSLDLSKRIVKKGVFELHALGGISYGKLKINPESSPSYFENLATFEIGTIIAIKSFVLSFCFSYYNSTDSRPLNTQSYSFGGIGLRF